MKISDTIPIVFHGGSYGTYLEWLLTTLCSETETVRPFKKNGNSHGFGGNHLHDMQGWHKYVTKDIAKQFVRFHPKTNKDESLSDNLDCVLSTVDKMIYLYPDERSKLLAINNYYFKVWECWWQYQFLDQINPDKIYKNWPVDINTTMDQIPVWIRREFLSCYLMPAWHDQVEWYHPDTWGHDRCLILSVSELLHDLVFSLTRIGNFCDLKFAKKIEHMIPYHNEMLQLQQYRGQDELCQQIVHATVYDQDMVWPDLPLPSQSWIQWQLRNLGFKLRCHGLDIFPANSIQLKKLTYTL